MPEIAQYVPCYFPLNVFTTFKVSFFLFFFFLLLLLSFAITAAGVVSRGGPKKSPRTSSIEQIKLFL